jgi:hypothetical protein
MGVEKEVTQSYTRKGALVVFCCWAAVGAAAGAAIAYFAYARQPREFAANAVVRFERFESELTSEQSLESESSQQTQVDPGTDQTTAFRKQPDESLLLCSQSVLSNAAVSGKLMEIPELRVAKGLPNQTSADDFVRDWVASGRLRVTLFENTSQGTLYRVSFSSELPSVSNRVVSAVVAAMVERFDGLVSQKRLTKKIWDIRERREELDRQTEVLRRSTDEIDLPEQAVLQNGSVVSPAAVKLDAAIRSFERLGLQRESLQQRLRRAEDLLVQNAGDRDVLEMLGVLTKDGKVPKTAVVASQDQSERLGSETDRREWLAEKQKFTAAVEQEVQPLQKQLDELLNIKYGPQHPQIKHLKMLIAKAKGKLAVYAVEPDFGVANSSRMQIGVAPDRPISVQDGTQPRQEKKSVGTTEQQGDTASAANSLEVVLFVLNGELKRLSNDLSRVDEELEALATIVANETQVLRYNERLRLEMQHLQETKKSLEVEMQHAQSLGEKVPTRCEVLIASGPAVQVSPILQPYLLYGSIGGVVAALTLFICLWLTISLVPGRTAE